MVWPYRDARKWEKEATFRPVPAILSRAECARVAGFLGKADSVLIEATAENDGLFTKLENAALAWDSAFELEACAALELVRLRPGAGWGWRSELGAGPASRCKLVAILPLDPPEAAIGGRVAFFVNDAESAMPELAMGDAIVFPSWAGYRITGIEAGERTLLIARFLGAPFH